jgi:hypothetical protein
VLWIFAPASYCAGVLAEIESAWTGRAPPALTASFTILCRWSRGTPSKAAETTKILKWLSLPLGTLCLWLSFSISRCVGENVDLSLDSIRDWIGPPDPPLPALVEDIVDAGTPHDDDDGDGDGAAILGRRGTEKVEARAAAAAPKERTKLRTFAARESATERCIEESLAAV